MQRDLKKIRAAIIAVVGGLVVFAIKLVAYYMSGSVALLSDALESTVNIVASALMFYSVYVSEMPADEDHHYGHQKIENISSLLEGTFILTAAVFIIHTALERIYEPIQLVGIEGALGVSFFATALNGGLSWYLSKTAEEKNSLALEGDAKHLLSDVITSWSVIAGLWVARQTGWTILDPLMAVLVAALIMRIGGKLILKSGRGLMDDHSPEVEAKIMKLLDRHRSNFLDYHDVKTRRSGNKVYAELHLSVDGSLSVQEAHNLTDHLEDDLRSELPNVTITIHIEPPRARSTTN